MVQSTKNKTSVFFHLDFPDNLQSSQTLHIPHPIYWPNTKISPTSSGTCGTITLNPEKEEFEAYEDCTITVLPTEGFKIKEVYYNCGMGNKRIYFYDESGHDRVLTEKLFQEDKIRTGYTNFNVGMYFFS